VAPSTDSLASGTWWEPSQDDLETPHTAETITGGALKRLLVVLGAVAACFAIASPAGAIASQPGAAGRQPGRSTSTPPQPVVPPSHHVRKKSHHAKSHHVQVAEQGTPLVGVFSITAGSCSSGTPSGTYFRMIEPGGTLKGPFLSNGNSPCAVQTYTPMSPGTAGGLSTVAYQPNPSPSFDSSGNGLANTITEPQGFFGVKFSLSTNSTDPQTSLGVAVPSISNSGGTLSGNLEAISVGWNNQNYNQGSPKPGGSTPGLTSVPTGTYNAASGAFTLTWASAIVGGPFNSFTGFWHLEGTFISSSSKTPTTTTTTAPTTTATTTGTHTSSSTGPSTATGASGAQQGSGTPDGPGGGTSGPLAMTGPPDDTKNVLLGALVLIASGIGLLLISRARSRKIAR
jgi:hypothetical protein